MIPIVSAALIKKLPLDLQPLLESGILLCAVAVVILNVFFNALASREEVEAAAIAAASTAEHA